MTATEPGRGGASITAPAPSLEKRIESAVMQLDALAEAVRLLVGNPAASGDPAYDAALAVQVRRRNMHVVPQHQEAS